MMRHPLHLHGHFFKVISGNGEHDVLKHTVDVAPMSSVTIEFFADAEKDWLFHCHNLYHAKTGMARVIRYSDYNGNSEFNRAKMNSREIMDTDWYQRSDLSLYNSHAELDFRLSNSRYAMEFNLELEENDHHEADLKTLKRWSPWLESFIGVNLESEDNQNNTQAMIGVHYTTPFLFETEIWINDDGKIKGEIESHFQLNKYFSLELTGHNDGSWEAELDYRPSPQFALSVSTRNDEDAGVGIKLTF